jgi:hypothetical protein
LLKLSAEEKQLPNKKSLSTKTVKTENESHLYRWLFYYTCNKSPRVCPKQYKCRQAPINELRAVFI